MAIDFINKFQSPVKTMVCCEWESSTLNANFTRDGIEAAIDYLKCEKSLDVDNIPAEFINACKEELANDLVDVFNYIIEKRDFPDRWTEGIQSAVHKGGSKRSVNDFRGITILQVMEKVFEIMVYKRLSFLNEALDKCDKWNGGYLQNIRTADNMFILNGVIQKHLILRKPLYICFDFSKAFDLVNRNILFYKLMRSGWSGRVFDTLRNLYSKTKFRVKCNGMLSPPILNEIGVNQGGVCSGLLFRKYVSDLEQYLMSEQGICIDENIVGHLLWADDLILFSDSVAGLQKQSMVLWNFAQTTEWLWMNLKKVMQFGKKGNFEVYFNGTRIDLQYI